MIPGPEDDRPLGKTYREVDRRTGGNEPWFMRAKRQYAEEESRRTIVEERMEPDYSRAGATMGHPDEDPRLKTGDLVRSKMEELDQELTAIRVVFEHLARLDSGTRKRVFVYVSEKLGDMP